MFDKLKYYQYIKTMEKTIITIYVIFIILFMAIGKIFGGTGTIVGGIIGFFIAGIYTINIKIKIQKMYWEMDIYEKLNNLINKDKNN